MNRRTRLLALVTLGLAGLLVAAFAARAFLLQPLRTLDDQITQLRLRLQSIDKERTSFLAADTQVRQVATTLFGTQSSEAEAAMGSLVTALIAQAGLPESDFTRHPAGRRRLAGAEEIGWTVQGEGPLAQVLDLLFLLQSHPRLHRLESLALSPASEPGRLRLRFRYLTLVLNPAPDVRPRTDLVSPGLDSPARRLYDPILQRDLLRPFQPGENQIVPGPTLAVAGPNEAQFLRVVSLSSWGARPEAHLLDTRTQSTRALHPGEPLLDGLFADVDYRPLPAAGKPGLLSYSRLIWRVGDHYWAVDTGQSLADRRPLASHELPPSLSTNPPTSALP